MRISLQNLFFSAVILLSFPLRADQPAGQFQVGPHGSINIPGSGAYFTILHFDGKWNVTSVSDITYKSAAGYPKTAKDTYSDKGTLKLKDGGAIFLERNYTLQPDGALLVEASVVAETPVKTNDLDIALIIPQSKFAGRTMEIGTDRREITSEKQNSLIKPAFGNVLIPCSDFKLKVEGKGELLVQNDFSLRFKFDKSAGEISSAKITLKLSAVPYDARPLELSQAMNMGFADEVADDGKGGWTDQGPENDLRMIKPGVAKYRGAPFSIVNPAKNGGRSCIVLSETKHKFPQSASITVPNQTMKSLLLLHAIAWPPKSGTEAGKIEVSYADGSKSELSAIAGKNVGNWWSPIPLQDACPAWMGENKNTFVGLYLTEFNVEQKPVTGIVFKAAGDAVWMIVAATAANEAIPKTPDTTSYIVESKDWRPMDFNKKDLQPGSALDFSSLLDAPAGKYGPVVIRDGHFEFVNKPGVKQRFYGVNLCFSCSFPSKENAEKLASHLAMCGYNSIRFHHFDFELANAAKGASYELDPALMDKMDYLFKCLKDKGIYSTIDLFTARRLKKGEVQELNRPLIENADVKASIFILDSAMENWRNFSKNFLLHVNPYTGKAWKDEVSLIDISLVNEDNILGSYASCGSDIKALYESKFNRWLKDKGIAPANDADRNHFRNIFLIETYNAGYAKLVAYLHSLGVNKPFTDQNCSEGIVLDLMYDQYDYVDNHFYWDHPEFPVRAWSLPTMLTNTSAMNAMFAAPSKAFHQTRHFGKPFTITEFNWNPPCAYRAESGALTGAYAALQGFDGLYRFAWSHWTKDSIQDAPINFHDVARDPINYLSDRIGIMLFLRGDVAESSVEVPVVINTNAMETLAINGRNAILPKICAMTNLVAKVGTVINYDGKPKLPAGARMFIDGTTGKSDEEILEQLRANFDFGKGSLDIARRTARSSTGEIDIDAGAGLFKVVTARSETFVFAAKGEISGNVFSAVVPDAPATLFASSLDGRNLADSSRILILHLTDAADTKTRFGNEKHTLLEAWGTLPHLARAGTAALKLKLAPGNAPKVYALDFGGRRIGEVNADISKEGVLSFGVNVFGQKTPCMAYEIVR